MLANASGEGVWPADLGEGIQNLDSGERAVEAFGCGELQAAFVATNPDLQLPFAVQSTEPCVPANVYGRPSLRLDRSRTSTSGTVTNLTDFDAGGGRRRSLSHGASEFAAALTEDPGLPSQLLRAT